MKLLIQSVASTQSISNWLVLRRITLGILLSFWYLQVCSCRSGIAPPSVKWSGKGSVYVVHFPGYWDESETTIMSGPGKYEIRKKIESGQEILLIKKRSGTNNNLLSRNQYAVSLPPKIDAWPATVKEWEIGQSVEKYTSIVTGYTNSKTSPQFLEYGGEQYQRSGASWVSKLGELSPDKRWLVVFSHTGEGPYEHGPFGGEEKFQKRGKIYLDIYDTRTWKKGDDATMRVNYTYSGGSAYISETIWVENRYLIISVDYSDNNFICWEIPKD